MRADQPPGKPLPPAARDAVVGLAMRAGVVMPHWYPQNVDHVEPMGSGRRLAHETRVAGGRFRA